MCGVVFVVVSRPTSVIPSTATTRTPPHTSEHAIYHHPHIHTLTPHAHTSQHDPTTHHTHTHTHAHTHTPHAHTHHRTTQPYTTTPDRPLYHTANRHRPPAIPYLPTAPRPPAIPYTHNTRTHPHTHTTHAHTAHHCPTLYVPPNRTHTARSTILTSPAYNIRDSTGCQLFVVGRGGVGCHDTIPCTMKPVAGQPPAEPRGTPAAGPSRAATPGAHTTTSAAGATPTPPDTAAPSIYGQWYMRALTQQGPAAPGHTIRPSK